MSKGWRQCNTELPKDSSHGTESKAWEEGKTQNLQTLPGCIWREYLANLSNVAIPSTSADASKRLKTSLSSEWNSCSVIRRVIKPTKELMNF